MMLLFVPGFIRNFAIVNLYNFKVTFTKAA